MKLNKIIYGILCLTTLNACSDQMEYKEYSIHPGILPFTTTSGSWKWYSFLSFVFLCSISVFSPFTIVKIYIPKLQELRCDNHFQKDSIGCG